MKLCLFAAALLASTLASPASARDTVLHILLADVLAMPEAQEKLDASMKFFLAGQATPKVVKRLSATPRPTASEKNDEFGCKWAALSALTSLQNGTKREGANAVIDIVSYYKKNKYRSATHFECHASGLIIGVALKGTYAQLSH